MRNSGRCDDDGVYIVGFKNIVWVSRRLDIPVVGADLLQLHRIGVAYPSHFALLMVVEVANEVRPPVASSEHSNADHFLPPVRSRCSAARKSGLSIPHQPVIGFILV